MPIQRVGIRHDASGIERAHFVLLEGMMFGFGAHIVEFLLGLFVEGGEKVENALLERGINLENIVLIVLAVVIIAAMLCVVVGCIWAVASGFLTRMSIN